MWSDNQIIKSLFNRRMLICVFTGFASGLPLYVVYTLLPAWLRSEGVSLTNIGFFALVGTPYTWKFFYSPLIDRYPLPFLGIRRGWMFITQIILFFIIAAFGWFEPNISLWSIAVLAFALALFSASLDIVLDAYRRELLPDSELGLGNSIHVNAYRVAGLIPGSLALILSDHLSWEWVYFIVALFILPGIFMTLFIKELEHKNKTPNTLKDAIVLPFIDFFTRNGVKQALWVLAFMLFYKLGDSMATALSTPFYLDLGFTKTQIGIVAKNAALWPMVIGGMAGGLLMVKIGINKALWLFGFVQIITIGGFVVLAEVGNNLAVLAVVIAFEYLGVGLGTAAFVAFIARSTNKTFVVTQFALLTALTALPRTFANSITGIMVDYMGWSNFFWVCIFLAIPGMLMLFKVAPFFERSE
ncbi:MAG: AmpG family muropeptide MFS transporter [Gammaproteobacteria bacterium]|nr:MAG: AmpG family muropeptide MFS transporter [Gammaproteobacteria bacterium]